MSCGPKDYKKSIVQIQDENIKIEFLPNEQEKRLNYQLLLFFMTTKVFVIVEYIIVV